MTGGSCKTRTPRYPSSLHVSWLCLILSLVVRIKSRLPSFAECRRTNPTTSLIAAASNTVHHVSRTLPHCRHDMTLTLPQAPSWSEQIEPSICSWDHGWHHWSYGNHQGNTTLSNVREAARDGCVRCKLLLRGIEKSTFPPYRPHRTTEATLTEYEPDQGLRVNVRNDPDTPLRVTVQYTGMASKSGSLPMELYFYTHPGSFASLSPTTCTYYAQTSHLTFRIFSQQDTLRLTLPPKLALT